MRLMVLLILIVAGCTAAVEVHPTGDRVSINGGRITLAQIQILARVACGDRQPVMISSTPLPWKHTRLYEYECVD